MEWAELRAECTRPSPGSRANGTVADRDRKETRKSEVPELQSPIICQLMGVKENNRFSNQYFHKLFVCKRFFYY